MDLKSIKKKFFTPKKNYKHDVFTVNPDLYWKSILVLSTLIVFGFFTFGFFLSRKIDDESGSALPANLTAPEAVSKDKLQKVIDYFAKRERISLEIINSPSAVIDPSL